MTWSKAAASAGGKATAAKRRAAHVASSAPQSQSKAGGGWTNADRAKARATLLRHRAAHETAVKAAVHAAIYNAPPGVNIRNLVKSIRATLPYSVSPFHGLKEGFKRAVAESSRIMRKENRRYKRKQKVAARAARRAAEAAAVQTHAQSPIVAVKAMGS